MAITTTMNSTTGHTDGHRLAESLPLSRMPRTSPLKYKRAQMGMPVNGNLKPEEYDDQTRAWSKRSYEKTKNASPDRSRQLLFDDAFT
jgi:hypothetical protein